VLILCLGTTAKVTTQDTGSTEANRIIAPSTNGQIVGFNGLMLSVYDGTTSRWRESLVDAGAWIVPAFAGGDFTGGGSQTWTLTAGDVTTYQYQQRGNTVAFQFVLNSTTVGGTPNATLKLSLQGFEAAHQLTGPLGYASDNSTVKAGLVQISATETAIQLFNDLTLGTNWAAATNTTTVRGAFVLDVT